MLQPTLDTLRLFVHVVAASIWVGGQITLAGVVPALRRRHPESTPTLARSFARLAWPSYMLLVLSGVWSLVDVDVTRSEWEYAATAMTHVAAAAIAAVFTAVHTIGRSKLALALGGAIGLLSSLAALFLGLVLRTGR